MRSVRISNWSSRLQWDTLLLMELLRICWDTGVTQRAWAPGLCTRGSAAWAQQTWHTPGVLAPLLPPPHVHPTALCLGNSSSRDEQPGNPGHITTHFSAQRKSVWAVSDRLSSKTHSSLLSFPLLSAASKLLDIFKASSCKKKLIGCHHLKQKSDSVKDIHFKIKCQLLRKEDISS